MSSFALTDPGIIVTDETWPVTDPAAVVAADTWGIASTSFVLLYAALGVAALIAALLLRRRALTRGSGARATDRDPYEIAYLSGGPGLVVASVLSALRTQGLITNDGATLRVAAATPGTASYLDRAVLDAVASGRISYAKDLSRDDTVRRAIDDVRDGLEAAGLVPGPSVQRSLRQAALPLVAVALLGGARFWAGMLADKPVLILVLGVAVAIAAAAMVARVPRQLPTARATLTELRHRNRYLAPDSAPSWHLYGSASAALAVGLFGGAALVAAEPAFASATGLGGEQLHSSNWISGTGSSSTGSGCGGGSSCGGATSSCGGGSGCGGGGCGG